MTPIAELRTRRDALLAQRSSGVARVSYDGKTVEYRSLAEIDRALEALERFIGLHAATRATADDLRALEALHADLAAAVAEPARYSDLNAAFHDRLAATARNGQVQQIYAGLQAQVRRARHAVNHDPARIAASLAEHEGIMDALRIRAPLDLAERLATHNAVTARAILAQFEGGQPALSPQAVRAAGRGDVAG